VEGAIGVLALGGGQIALGGAAFVDVLAGWRLFELLGLAASHDIAADQLVSLEALHPGLVAKEIGSRGFHNKAVGNLRELKAPFAGTPRHISAPGAIGHTGQHRMTVPFVTRFTFVLDNSAIATTTSIQ